MKALGLMLSKTEAKVKHSGVSPHIISSSSSWEFMSGSNNFGRVNAMLVLSMVLCRLDNL